MEEGIEEYIYGWIYRLMCGVGGWIDVCSAWRGTDG